MKFTKQCHVQAIAAAVRAVAVMAGGRTFDIGDAVTIGLDVGQIRLLPG